jgi:plasmid stabilization system protein ParE
MKVRYAETALRELDGIFAYTHERNPAAAVAIVERIERLTGLIGELPFIGPLTDEAGVRMMPVVRYPFLIFYAVNEAADEVVILHIRHGARQHPGEAG